MKAIIGRIIIETDGSCKLPVAFYTDAFVFQEQTVFNPSIEDLITDGIRATAETLILAHSATNSWGMTTADMNTSTYLADFVGDTGSGGIRGAVPAPTTGDGAKYLRGNGTWGTIAGGGDFVKAVDDTDDIIVGTTNKFATAAEKTKLGFISVTQAVDLDTMESDILTKQPLATGTPNGTKYLRDDNSWQAVTAAQPDIPISLLAPTIDETVAAGYSAYVSDYYEIADQKFLECGVGSVLEIG